MTAGKWEVRQANRQKWQIQTLHDKIICSNPPFCWLLVDSPAHKWLHHQKCNPHSKDTNGILKQVKKQTLDTHVLASMSQQFSMYFWQLGLFYILGIIRIQGGKKYFWHMNRENESFVLARWRIRETFLSNQLPSSGRTAALTAEYFRALGMVMLSIAWWASSAGLTEEWKLVTSTRSLSIFIWLLNWRTCKLPRLSTGNMLRFSFHDLIS